MTAQPAVLDQPTENYLRPNGHGGYLVRQSDLSAWSRCQLQKYYYDRAKANPDAPQPTGLSATIYGTCVHYALMLLEQRINDGDPDALEVAIKTFEHYWHPDNLFALTGERIDEWLPRQTYGGLRERGRTAIRDYYALLTKDDNRLLALEYQFAVPIEVNDRLHTLTGTVDRLALRQYYRKPYLSLDDFKGLALDTPLPTPTGWTTMGAVQVGEELLGRNGRPTSVTAKSQVHHRPCYRIDFDDGSSVVADNVHLWSVHAGPVDGMTTETINTDELKRRLDSGQVVRIFNADPLQLPQAELPIDPYVLGAWIGDGNRGRGVITKPDQELFDRIATRGYKIGVAQVDSRTGCQSRTILGLQSQLSAAGYLGHKRVPEIYLRGSFQQRLDLLRGLMDTDGSWNKRRRRAVFCTTDKALADSVRELVVSLGWKATVFDVQRAGFGQHVTAYDVCFTPVSHNPFSLTRKAELVDTLDYPWTQRPWRRQVRTVVEVPSVPTQCIQVDAEDSLYLCGEQMVPTHNTGKQPTYLRYNMQGSAYAYATTRPEFWEGWADSGLGELETFDTETIGRLEEMFSSWGYRLHSGSHGELPLASRRFRWINIQEIKFADGGWRTERDYARLKLAVDAYVRACEAGVYSVNTTGEICRYCPFMTTCGGLGLPAEKAGAP